MTTPRRNRIIDHRVVKGRDLLPNPANWRTHPPQQRAATTAALDLLGYVDELKVVATPEGMLLLDGHLRAQIGEDDDIPVAVVDLDPDEQRIFLATYDPLAAMAITDLPAFDALTDVIATEDETLMRLLEGVRQHDTPLLLAQRPERDAEVTGGALDKVEADDYEPFTKRGQVWQLGDHRLMCGDATSTEDVKGLSEDSEISMLLTDPPYCSGGFQEAGRMRGSIGSDAKIKRTVARDMLSTRGYQALMNSVIGMAPVAMLYAFTDWRMWVNLYDVVESSGYGVRNMIVWDKGSPGMGVGWRTQHELVLFAAAAKVEFDNHKAQGNVIAVQRTGNPLHPTQKPVELLEAILNVTDMASSVYDPFVGSGSTIIAAENLGRRCYAMDIEPRYCDVAIQRWEAYTGAKAELLE